MKAVWPELPGGAQRLQWYVWPSDAGPGENTGHHDGGVRWDPTLHLCVTAGHTLTSALLALIRTSRLLLLPPGLGPIPAAYCLPRILPGSPGPVPAASAGSLDQSQAKKLSVTPLSQKTLQRSGWGGGGRGGEVVGEGVSADG